MPDQTKESGINKHEKWKPEDENVSPGHPQTSTRTPFSADVAASVTSRCPFSSAGLPAACAPVLSALASVAGWGGRGGLQAQAEEREGGKGVFLLSSSAPSRSVTGGTDFLRAATSQPVCGRAHGGDSWPLDQLHGISQGPRLKPHLNSLGSLGLGLRNLKVLFKKSIFS